MLKKLLPALLALVLLLTATLTAGAETVVRPAGDTPWVETTAEEIMEKLGFEFGMPEGIQEPVYRMLEDYQLAEMNFTLEAYGEDIVFCARIMSESEFRNMSGVMANEWSAEEDCEFQGLQAQLLRLDLDTGETIEVFLWFDVVPGLMYSVTAQGMDLDGFDIQAIAEQLYIPTQGDVG